MNTDRLRHSIGGFVRRMQISQHRLWVMVEGIGDRPFYDAIVQSRAQLAASLPYVCISSDVIQGRADGKQAVLGFYRYMRHRNLLNHDFKGHTKIFCAILDKDLDDVFNRKARSLHVLYLEYYNIENYLFRYGNIRLAAQFASGLDSASLARRVPIENQTWCEAAMLAYVDWTAFSLLAKKRSVPNMSGIGRDKSPIHVEPYGPVDRVRLGTLSTSAALSLGWSLAHFERQLNLERSRLVILTKKAEGDRVFNGKWYTHFLISDIQSVASGRQFEKKALSEKLRACLMTTLDFASEWATSLSDRLVLLIA